MIPPRTLGTGRPEVSAIGGPFWADGDRARPLGWGEVDDAESVRAIEAALEWGITLFDTRSATPSIGSSNEG